MMPNDSSPNDARRDKTGRQTPQHPPRRTPPRSPRRTAGAWAAGCAVLAAVCIDAHAAYSPIVGSRTVDEPGVADVLDHLFGPGDFGGFVETDSSFSNGRHSAHRVDDFQDQIWSGRYFIAEAVGRFSGYSQQLGFFDAGGDYRKLFDITGDGFAVSGRAEFKPPLDSFAFARSGDSGTQSSENAANADENDHLVTYAIDGDTGDSASNANTASTWLMFWEDLNRVPGLPKYRSTTDFNDAIVLLRETPVPPGGGAGAGPVEGGDGGTGGGGGRVDLPAVVPLPPALFPAVGTSALALGAAALRRARRSRPAV